MLDIVNFLEWTYGLKENESEKSLEHHKALEKFGLGLDGQNFYNRLKKIKIELYKIIEEYDSFKNKKTLEIVKYINFNISFIDKILNSDINQAQFDSSSIKQEASHCKLQDIKNFCKAEKKTFFSR